MAKPTKSMTVVKPIQFTSGAYSRETEATRYNENGFLEVVAANVLRQGYDPATLAYTGAIYEDAGVNYVGESFTDPYLWDFNGVTLGAVPSVLSPAGILQTVYSAGDDGSGPMVEQITTVPAGNVIFSVYAKLIPGQMFAALLLGFDNNVNAVFDVANGSVNLVFGGVTAGVQHLPNSWHRFYVSGSTSTGKVNIGVSGGYPLTSLFKIIYLYRPQVENVTQNNLPSSYMTETDSSPTAITYRAADVATSTPPFVLDSNVDEDDYDAWIDSHGFAVDEYTMVPGLHRNYKAISANTNKYPPDFPLIWRDAGATNAWRMFDMKVGADIQTENDDLIRVTVQPGSIADAVCLFNVSGTYARVIVKDGETVIYEKQQSLLPLSSGPSWYAFHFGERMPVKDVLFLDLPPKRGVTITIEILTYAGTTAKIGKAVIGRKHRIGFSEYGSSASITDYSDKQTDPFGNTSVVPRRFVGKMDLRIVIDRDKEDFVHRKFSELRAIPAVYIGHEKYKSLLVLGFFNDFTVLFSSAGSSYCNTTVTGI